jgi:hypothetical protein
VTYPAQLHDPGGFIASLPRLCRQAVLIADSGARSIAKTNLTLCGPFDR